MNKQEQTLALLDNSYKQWQEYAKANGHERLLAQAVTWSHDHSEEEWPEGTDRWVVARRVVTWQTAANVAQGLKPEELWAALVG